MAKTSKPVEKLNPPKGWFLAGLSPNLYESSIDRTEFHSGSQSAFLRNFAKVKKEDWATLMQNMHPHKYLGKRVQMSFWLKTKDVDGWAQAWLRVDGSEEDDYLAFDNMCNRGIHGTTDWTEYKIVLDVPESSTNIGFGIMLGGKGCLWFDDVSFTAVTSEVSVTECPCSSRGQLKDAPQNLDFEEGVHDGDCC